jgi:hypothetical protein
LTRLAIPPRSTADDRQAPADRGAAGGLPALPRATERVLDEPGEEGPQGDLVDLVVEVAGVVGQDEHRVVVTPAEGRHERGGDGDRVDQVQAAQRLGHLVAGQYERAGAVGLLHHRGLRDPGVEGVLAVGVPQEVGDHPCPVHHADRIRPAHGATVTRGSCLVLSCAPEARVCSRVARDGRVFVPRGVPRREFYSRMSSSPSCCS